ncbi:MULTISPECIES: helix-turn-helix domain-containing protein [unclassified Clostridium]|uniref:helix-turn-helix domain-containing protein n=1 Tax=unclassified Clostridium TaxID=2614128 RepID=UPI000EC0475E|nr:MULTISPECIES: helix-turn-helix transcriptional regulator [unclassified Clostridium]HCQ89207.1 XRE family transcriptional regulator [Clostridium sp.]
MLKNARKSKRMSQKYLAKRLGITQSYLSKLENKEKYNKNVTIDLVERIAEELDLDSTDVFFYFCRRS